MQVARGDLKHFPALLQYISVSLLLELIDEVVGSISFVDSVLFPESSLHAITNITVANAKIVFFIFLTSLPTAVCEQRSCIEPRKQKRYGVARLLL